MTFVISRIILFVILITRDCFLVKGVSDFKCPNDDCRIWWSAPVDDFIPFGIEGRVQNDRDYVAMAFSKDSIMGDDSAYVCFKNGANYELKRVYNNGNSPVIYPKNMAGDLELIGKYENGKLTCNFKVPTSRDKDPTNPGANEKVFYPLEQNYNLLYAQGVMTSPDLMAYHARKYPSGNAFNFNSKAPPPPTSVSDFKCPNDDCRIWWSAPVDDFIPFGIEGRVQNDKNYVAMAFSKDSRMGDDSTYVCFKNADNYELKRGYNNGKSNTLNPKNLAGDLDLIGKYENGKLTCNFKLPTSRDKDPTNPGANEQIFYPLDQNYNLLFSQGDMTSPEKLAYHKGKYASQSQVDFAATNSSLGASNAVSSPLIRAHGIMMVIAWFVFASTASLFPRYFKSAHPNTKIQDSAVWFRFHQSMMSTTFILTIIAFILIFVHVKGYAISSLGIDSAHPPVGISVMILTFINPFMTLLRCHPGHKNRWMFNLAHLLVGQFALVLAVVAIFLSTLMQKANVEWWMKWLVVAGIGWHVLIELLLMAHDKYLQGLPADRESVVLENGTHISSDSWAGSKNDWKSYIKTILICCQWVGVTGIAMALCVGIGMAL